MLVVLILTTSDNTVVLLFERRSYRCRREGRFRWHLAHVDGAAFIVVAALVDAVTLPVSAVLRILVADFLFLSFISS